MNDVVATLTAARELLSDPERWTQEAPARKQNGMPVSGTHPKAICWCAIGAIFKGGRGHLDAVRPATRILASFLDASTDFCSAITAFNDSPFRDHADVLAAFDRAIVKAKEEAS